MPYTYPGQGYDHTLHALKGWLGQGKLDIHGTLSSSVNINSTGEPVVAGMCLHVASLAANTGPGYQRSPKVATLAMGASAGKVPLFTYLDENDFSVSNLGVPSGVAAGGTTDNPAAWVSGIPNPSGKVLSCLVALGGYELETTEFDDDQTYTANNGLRAVTSNTNANAGKLTNQDASGGVGFATSGATVFGNPGVAAWDSIVGWVSRGVYANGYGKSVLAFWSDHQPGTR